MMYIVLVGRFLCLMCHQIDIAVGKENQASFKKLVVDAVNIYCFNNTMDGCIFESISLEVK